MVVGSGQTGAQIAEELHAAGRRVHLCVGRAGRLPRRYRGRDAVEWQRDMGYLDRTPDMLDRPSDRFRGDPHLTGKDGGRTLSLHDFRRSGIRLLGRLVDCDGERARFDDGLHEQMRYADAFSDRIIELFDRHIEENRVDAPPPTATELAGGPPPDGELPDVVRELDLAESGINTVIWAVGLPLRLLVIEAPVLDDAGYPVAPGGITTCPGLYFMGLNWMTRRKSGIIYGVSDDGYSVAEHIGRRVTGLATRRRASPE